MGLKLDGYWEEGYHYYLEIKGRRAVLRDYAKRVIFKTSLQYDRAAVARGEAAELKLGETVLSRTAAGEPMTWIKALRFENGQIVMDYYYTIMGDTQYVLKKVDHGPFDDIVIRDREILPRIRGLWLEWSKNGISEQEYGLRIKGNELRYGSKDSDIFKSKIHAISYKGSPDRIILTPADLTVREFPGMTQLTVEKDMITGYMIVCDVSTPLSVFLRRENYNGAEIPPEALKEAKNTMVTDVCPPAPPVKEEPKIRIISQPKPDVCGGTDATLDENAPKTIASDDMILFDVTSVLNTANTDGSRAKPQLAYVSAFAAPADGGTFLFLETRETPFRRDDGEKSFALVKGDVFHKLAALVREYDLAKENGFHSTTHGLPENFGGSIIVRYADGEKISVSNNQTPVLEHEAGEAIAKLFGEALGYESAPLADVGSLRSVRFDEERDDGGFTRAVLTINADGTGKNEKEQKFSDTDVFRSTKEVSADTVAAVKASIENGFMLAWPGLPETGYKSGGEKSLTFVFDDGEEITVKDGRILPDQLRSAFFKIELELSTKN